MYTCGDLGFAQLVLAYQENLEKELRQKKPLWIGTSNR